MAANKIQVGYIEPQDGVQFKVDEGTAAAPGICFVDSAATGLYSPGTGQIAWSTSGKQTALRILADGKVGIDCSPTVALEVNGTIKASAIEAPIEGTLDDWIVHAGDTNTKFGFPANDTFEVHAGGGPRLQVTSGGNVDINGTPPWSVAGGDYRNLSISGQVANSGGFLWLGNGTATTNGDFDLGRINFCNGATITSQIAGTTQTSANDDGRIGFHTKATGGSLAERLRITSGGVINIGQGNEAAAVENLVELYVGGNNTSHATIRGKYNRTNEYNRSEVRFGVEDNSAGKGFLAFATGTNSASERLRINSAGTVRIKHAVSTSLGNDSIFLGIGDTENGANVNRLIGFGYVGTFGTSVYPASMGYTETDNAGHTRGALTFNTRNTTGGTDVPVERLRITSSGVVSIGGRDPAISANVGLEISGHATTEIRLKNTAGGWNSSDGLAIQKWSNGNSYFWEYDAQDILFGTSNSERIRIKSTGEVGINKSSPNSGVKLHVGGTARFDDDVSIITGKKLFTNSSQGQLTIQGGATYPGSAIKFAGGQGGATDQGQMIFYAGTDTSLTEVGRITNDGNHRRAKHSRFATRIDYDGGNEAANSKIPFETPHVNVGSDFDSSNERYVAPVDGDYAFWFHTNVARSGAGNYYATWMKNGSEVNSIAGGRMYDQHSGSGWNNLSGCLMINLDEGDYIEIFNGGVAVNYDGGNYGQWMGWLVG